MKPIKILIILYLFVSSFITKAQGGDLKFKPLAMVIPFLLDFLHES